MVDVGIPGIRIGQTTGKGQLPQAVLDDSSRRGQPIGYRSANREIGSSATDIEDAIDGARGAAQFQSGHARSATGGVLHNERGGSSCRGHISVQDQLASERSGTSAAEIEPAVLELQPATADGNCRQHRRAVAIEGEAVGGRDVAARRRRHVAQGQTPEGKHGAAVADKDGVLRASGETSRTGDGPVPAGCRVEGPSGHGEAGNGFGHGKLPGIDIGAVEDAARAAHGHRGGVNDLMAP